MFWQTKTDYEFGPFRIDAGERQLLRHGQIVPLTPKVFDVLLALVQHNGRILTKDEVIRIVWPDTTVEEGNLSRNISTLRCALGERPREGRYIETIPWRGYRFVAAVRQVTDREQRPAIESIAILPFLNVNDAKLEYLADGIAETLTSNLAQLTNLRVTSRNSSFRYKGRDPDVKTIGRELKVQAVLIGRIAETEDMLSISVELVETVDDRHIWGAQYIRKRTDLLEAQETIAKQIAERLRIELTGGEKEMLVKRHTNNNEAYFSLLKGRYHFNKLTFDGVQKAAAYFREAIEKDPNYALAYAGLGDCNNYLNEREHAKQAVIKALDLDENLGEAHASLGFFKFLYEWDFDGAESEFVTAVALSPNYAEAHHWYAVYLANMGRHDEAFREAELAVERDPLSLLMNMTAALNFYTGREYDRAIDQLRKVIELEANFLAAHSVLGCVYAQKQLHEQALMQFEKVLDLCKGSVPVENSVKILKAQTYARCGNIREVKSLLDETGDGPVSFYSLAGVHAALGDRDKAFEFLRKAFDQRDLQMVSLKVDPTLDPIRDDPRFVNLIREVGLPI